ncbi:hypothetical protein TraAM80_02435 [Trypanosoma rangeli]|uniref:C3H1-type domain-containing protein n=1 Tax=Trypanosoma rangeli TaxID=5698 RepID=A0A3R7MP61_TRYRA|nr:uncharacterized protein TraAM80_02435 [Trypanosoma rangeli]RNF09038.1 hypothetical protein TraAM80_02435 [Trypanosoma rangeli]|eukprot:RNF09038.1 hypothetical protein TraAM80_02435 [Trypanosoma rangeli]
MFFIDPPSRSFRLPSPAPVFTQSFSQLNPTPSMISLNDVQSCASEGAVTPHQTPLFTVSQPNSVIAAPLPPAAVMWTPNSMYGATPMGGGPEAGTGQFISSKGPDGPPMSPMQSVFIPQLQQSQQPQTSTCPLVYMLTTVAVPQPYTQTALPEQQNRQAPLYQHHLFPMEGSSIASSSSMHAHSLNPSGLARNSDAMQTRGPGNKVNVNVVCRHFINSCCNRRKCRFLHTLSESPVTNV